MLGQVVFGQCLVVQYFVIIVDYVVVDFVDVDFVGLFECLVVLVVFVVYGQVVVVYQLIRSGWCVVMLQVGGCSDDYLMVFGQFYVYQVGIGQGGNVDGDVDVFFDDVGDVVVQVECEGDIVVFGQEGGNQWCYVLVVEFGWG